MPNWLDEIEKRAKKATAGPWEIPGPLIRDRILCPEEKSFHSNGTKRTHPRGLSSASYSDTIMKTDHDVNLPEPMANLEFIAHSREDIPRLARVVRRLRDEIRGLMHTGEYKGCPACEALRYDGTDE